MKLQYRHSQPLVDNIRTFVFTPLHPISWEAGQYIHYTLPHDAPDDRGVERWFTVSSAPFQKDIWITTRWFKDSASSFKKALNNLSPGDFIEVDEPEGDFIEIDSTERYIFVAGGIGITPFRSIVNQLDFEGKPIRAELLFANHDEATIPFKKELELLSEKHPDFNITYFIGDNKINQSVLQKFGDKFNNPYYYVSGPEPMVEVFEAMLKSMSVDESRLKFDFFPGYKEV